MDLQQFDLIVVNSSGGKDSVCALFEVCRLADEQGYPKHHIVVSHQDLGKVEWQGTKDLVLEQSKCFGINETVFSKRRNQAGENETLLEYVLRRGKWPSNKQRYCTSDFKRDPGARVVRSLAKGLGECKVLHVFGFRSAESPARRKKLEYTINTRLSTQKRKVYDWLPIHDWSDKKVWNTIKANGLPYHKAYDLGMPRLSCCFCIFSPFDALVLAGRENPELLNDYVEVEKTIGHTFRDGFAIADVQKAIADGYEPKKISDWVM